MGNELYLHGKKYISVRRGAEITKYNNDYIGQLCRAGKVDSIKIGRNWYLTEDSLLSHKAYNNVDSGKRLTVDVEEVKTSTKKDIPTYHFDDEKPLIPTPTRPKLKPTYTPKKNHTSYKKKLADFTSVKSPILLSKTHSYLSTAPVAVPTELLNKSVALLTAVVLVFGSFFIHKSPHVETVYNTATYEIVQVIDSVKHAKVGSEITKLVDYSEAVALNSASAAYSAVRGVGEVTTGVLETVSLLARGDRSEWNRMQAAMHETAHVLRNYSVYSFVDTKSAVSNFSHKHVANPLVSIGQTFASGVRDTAKGFASGVDKGVQSLIALFAPAPVVVQEPVHDFGGEPPVPSIEYRTVVIEGSTNVIERITERVVETSGISSDELDTKLQQLNNRLSAEIYDIGGGNSAQIVNNYRVISQSSKIDDLGSVTIHDSTFSDGTITGSSFAGTTGTFSSSITANGASFSGVIHVTSTATSTFTGGIQTNALDVQSTTATSTFANGIRLEGGTVRVQSLVSCDTVDTDANGNFICGDDASGGASIGESGNITMAFATSTFVGIGTTTPEYKLHVIGDVAATSFVNISTETSKKDIMHLTEAEKDDILTKIENVEVAEYRYQHESEDAPLRLGLIAEEAPQEVLSVDGNGVDIYKLATFTLTGVQELSEKLKGIEMRIADIEAQLALQQGSGQAGGGGFSLSSVVDYLASLGVKIAQGVIKIANLFAYNLTVGSQERPTGITLYDEVTGEPYCLKIRDGVTVTEAGACPLVNDSGSGSTATSTPTTDGDISTSANASADKEPPTITINGNNPAQIELNSDYSDLGALVTDPSTSSGQAINNNLGYTTTVNGEEVNQVQIDTTTVGEHSIIYTATDEAGNTATAERTVVVFDPNAPAEEVVEPVVIEETATSTPPVVIETPEPVVTEEATSTPSTATDIGTSTPSTATEPTGETASLNI